ncbi:hypothetical protein HAP47_0005275 [Bradyrhizobium sp. 41S5]|uniref:hypothetical protein n=1 Tax=Bradyrhizobium sp. 41S5 TaxID=1404443 RepID=UPI00156BD126|nr:hypothetical protein [Bradyrhizobium sp. 41S5]UFX46123.1 hypothetical protein HAP47_0005275 [Bradyrhizobium sp. 41S5]
MHDLVAVVSLRQPAVGGRGHGNEYPDRHDGYGNAAQSGDVDPGQAIPLHTAPWPKATFEDYSIVAEQLELAGNRVDWEAEKFSDEEVDACE